MFKQIFEFEISPSKTLAAGVGAVAAPWIDLIYGEGRFIPISLLLTAIVMDWITGIAASLRDETYSSEYGRHGILRTIFILAFPFLANLLDMMLGTPGLLFYAITLGLVYHTWQSLTANAYRAGWGKWIPDTIIKHIESELKAKVDRASQRGADSEGENSNR
ncbi:phage holin family protein [Paenibacillus sinopodophylli]|uniref:phage holin family protein n=1 Tax=Paenibacillus sinopodophylli TaxID=1837342 RepID=UPI00110C98F5|nr:phage holin family protein [Paenibacillus sinopodophylli]